ncbi:MAG TPA: PDZ domain-containing protein [Kofleriaceae bacterium]|nr:PDZ domain-containing protein [Kofleriaceae bacterium]
MLARVSLAAVMVASWTGMALAQPAQGTAEAPAWVGIGIGDGRLGVVVKTVWEPAATAGLIEGDEVMSVQGVRVMGTTELVAAVRQHQPGTTVRLDLLRGGKMRTVHVTLEAKPPNSELVERHLLGKPAPALAGEATSRARSATLVGHRGDVVVMAMFGSGCTSCAPVFSKLSMLAKGQERGLSVLGAMLGHPAAAEAVSSRHSLPFGLLSIADELASRWAWFDPAAPVIAVIDPRGVVRYAGTIDGGLSPEAAERAVAVEVDQAVFVAERLLRSARTGAR